MDENFIISRIQEILGDGFEVTESSSTGDVQVRSHGGLTVASPSDGWGRSEIIAVSLGEGS